METDYILRDAAKIKIWKCPEAYIPTQEGEDYLIAKIDSIPAADVAHVVFCKDCKWYRESEVLAPNRFCFRLKDTDGNHVGYNFAPNDFCSYGERREGGTP